MGATLIPEFTHPPYYPIVGGYFKYTDTELAASVGLPSLLLTSPGLRLILIQPEVQIVRWLDNGTDPTATDGMPLMPLGGKWIDSHYANYRFIRAAPGAILHIVGYN